MGIAIGLLLVAAIALVRVAVTVWAGGFVVRTTGPDMGVAAFAVLLSLVCWAGWTRLGRARVVPRDAAISVSRTRDVHREADVAATRVRTVPGTRCYGTHPSAARRAT